jgi:hypothetical protein
MSNGFIVVLSLESSGHKSYLTNFYVFVYLFIYLFIYLMSRVIMYLPINIQTHKSM